MLTLSLFRHAKSSWDDRSLHDFDRPLAARGTAAGSAMGSFMQDDIRPDLVLCSPARRTRDTFALVAPALGRPRVLHPQDLYLATPKTLVARVRKCEPRVRHLMLIGHNPGLHQAAVSLTGSGESSALEALGLKFPTAALAVLTFAANAWSDVGPGAGHLALFITPKRLP